MTYHAFSATTAAMRGDGKGHTCTSTRAGSCSLRNPMRRTYDMPSPASECAVRVQEGSGAQ